ncbi:hypothetical protein V9L05_18175 [Bernardetia sp. Wsw4-3y2]|uniref:hypothetical protein n=1 Tax=Bernardetia sp. Wsw4-3y2 TaxID=3127471 RepID=UPI0030D5D9EB
MKEFNTNLIQDYLKELHGEEIEIVSIDPSTTNVYSKYKRGNNPDECYILINHFDLMAFIYSKMEFQETEAPTTLEFRIDGQAIKEMVSESHEKFLELPFESQEFQEAWKDFLNSRIEMAGSISLEKTEKILKRLSKWEERDAIDSLEKSTIHGWSDVYPVSYPAKKNT